MTKQHSQRVLALSDELRTAFKLLVREMRRDAAGAEGDLPMMQTFLLGAIDENPGAGVAELARLQNVRGPTISGQIKALEAAGLIGRGAPDPDDRRRTGLQVTPAGRTYLKRIRAQRLDWLAQRLAEDARPTVIAMHHPPFATDIAHMDTIGLLEGAAELEAIVRRHPQVERVLCGHLHRPIQARFGGTLASTCPSPAHQVALDLRPEGPDCFVMEPPGYQLHAWRGGRLVTHTVVLGDWAGPYRFREDGVLID